MPATKPETTAAVGTAAPVPVKDLAIANRGQHTLVKGDGLHLALHSDVVEKIVGLAVREVPGVHALAPHGAGDRLIRIADKLTGADSRDLGVHVEIGTLECAADIYIVAEYGANIPKIAESIRKVVTDKVREMTGLSVRDVNIDVVDLFFEEDGKTSNRNLQ